MKEHVAFYTDSCCRTGFWLGPYLEKRILFLGNAEQAEDVTGESEYL